MILFAMELNFLLELLETIPELMYKLFSVAGYDKKQVEEKFSGMLNALSYGAPPHGGIAPGIDRIVMLLANEKNIRG